MLRLGKKPARTNAIKLRFGAYLSAPNLPVVPPVFGKPQLVSNWGMLANDTASSCVEAGAAHETKLWTAEATGHAALFNNENVLADYLAVNPGDTSYSNGTDVQEYAAYRQKTGIIDAAGQRHKIDGYVALEVGNIDQLALATYLFGAVGIGVDLPTSAMDQFNMAEPFTVVTSGSEGGHYMPVLGRNSSGNFILSTWARLQGATASWISKYMDEGIVYLSLERLKDGLSPQGFDVAALQRDLTAVQA